MGCSSSQPSGMQPEDNPEDNQKPTEKPPPATNINKKDLEKYLDLEKKTREYESKNVLKALELQQEHLIDLQETIKQLDKYYNDCVEKTTKEKADVDKMKQPTVKDFFKDQASYDAKLSKEQEEYLDALNTQEIAKKELDALTKQLEQVKAELRGLKENGDKLQALYKEQDDLLAKIFNGKYGSELEYKLESELDLLLDRKQRISMAKYKWSNARVLLTHSVTQLGVAVKKWTDLQNIQADNGKQRYVVATETRNNVIAAAQNITSAQQYLHTIEFPYCKSDEMVNLNKAANNIYTDMGSTDRHKQSLSTYSTAHQRAAALLQWVEKVISKTILKDLEKATVECNDKVKALRSERLRLIKEKIRESGGKNVNLDIDTETDIADKEGGGLVAIATEADNVSECGDLLGGSGQGDNKTAGAPTPVPLKDLAPMPKNDEIFGNIEDLKKQHEMELKEFEKAQELNKARMKQGLEEKLQERRNRRARQETGSKK